MKNILKITLSLFFVYAQTGSQIEQVREIVKKKGLTDKQVRNAAKLRGVSDEKIDNFLQKNTTSQLDNKIDEFPNIESVENLKIIEEDIDEEKENIEIPVFQEIKNKINYFGYNLFKKDPGNFQSSSVGVVDPNYLIGAGDEIIIMLWGETQFRQIVSVDREGFIFVPEVGQIFVNGLDLKLLESKLFRVFSQSYESLKPPSGNPTTFLDISLGNLRPLRIQVLGEVSQPGTYTVNPSTTLFSSLYYFDGPTTLGSLRDIHLIRSGEKSTTIDFYDYLLTGKKPDDQKLQLDDVIYIPPRLKTVTITGEVNRQGIYELKHDESFSDLIEIAGSLKSTAYLDHAQIDRIVPFVQRDSLEFDRIYVDINLNEVLNNTKRLPLHDGDKISIFPITDIRQNAVEIRGAINRPGKYNLGDGMNINQLIEKAGGVLSYAYLNRADIIRVNQDLTEKLIQINLKEVYLDSSKSKINIEPMDIITIYGSNDINDKDFVEIKGYVKNEGSYPLMEKMRISDLLFLSGGFIDKEFKERAYLERADLIRFNKNQITKKIVTFNLGDILKSEKSKTNYLLQAGDLIKVYNKDIFKSSKLVKIDGSVRNQGSYELKNNMSLEDLILEAGGLSDDMYSYHVEISRIDSSVSDFNSNIKIIQMNILEGLNKNIIKTDLENISEINLNYKLEPYDIVSIRPSPYFSLQKSVNITGSVLLPGRYTLVNDNETIYDIIKRCGGLMPNAYAEASYFYRNSVKVNIDLNLVLKNRNSKYNFKLNNNDSLVVNSLSEMVFILGEVNIPGALKFIEGKRVDYYLNNSGGLTQNANKNNIWIEYPNGKTKRIQKYKIIKPKVMDASKIVVSKKEEEEPFKPTEFLTDVTTIFANLTQAVAIFFLAKN